jgi:type I restriction enzyme S subunit
VKLGDVVTVVGGGTPSRANTSYWNGELPWATVTDMNQIRISSTVEKITQLGLKESSSNLIPKGTVIVATRVGLGKVSLPTIDVCINQDLKALIPISAGIINTEYLFSVMQSNGSLIESMGTGATVKGIRLEQLNSLPIPLPPLNQQKRITDRLKDAEEIKKTNTDSNKKIEELQSSLLQRAFRGEL